MDYRHIKVTNEEPQADGSRKIVEESYYDDLTARKVTYEKQILTTNQTLLRDAISCLEHIKDGSPEITITVKSQHGEPHLIVKRWVEQRQKFDRR